MEIMFSLSSWCLVIVVWLFLAVPWVCMQFLIVLFPDHTHYFLYACLADYSYGFLFNYTYVSQASDSVTTMT